MKRRLQSLSVVSTTSERIWQLPRRAIRRPVAVAPADHPELPMLVQFEGLTKAEQRAAVAGFPGGRRFILLN
ncbi:hypothetical protein [Devosia sp.]|uniref:hypothetical protein n=1 Tax=Devosia sp. TaxID=1871048 RepID=UPI003BA869CA